MKKKLKGILVPIEESAREAVKAAAGIAGQTLGEFSAQALSERAGRILRESGERGLKYLKNLHKQPA